eukprot:3851113-Rhodomonas_salina.2
MSCPYPSYALPTPFPYFPTLSLCTPPTPPILLLRSTKRELCSYQAICYVVSGTDAGYAATLGHTGSSGLQLLDDGGGSVAAPQFRYHSPYPPTPFL